MPHAHTPLAFYAHLMKMRLLSLVTLLAVLLFAACGEGGVVRAQGTVSLRAGWTNVAYGGESAPVDLALSNVQAAVEAVWWWDADAQAWQAYFPDGPALLSSLARFERDQAYWIRVAQDVAWAPIARVDFERGSVAIERAGGDPATVPVELADSSPQRSRGLMFRASLPAEEGMLFRFAADTTGGFWMQNTLVPLSIAFIDAAGRIVDIQDMEPLTTTAHAPPSAYRWTLEMNQGWFAAAGVAAGDTVRLLEG